MEIDFDAKDSVSDFVSVPPGTYLCRVGEVRVGTTRGGDERWSLRLVVAEGQHVGKQAAWDGLVFSTRGRSRARLVLQALGLPTSGRVEVHPGDLEGRSALVSVRPTEYESSSGQVVRRNEVPYDGYRTPDLDSLTAAELAAGAHPDRANDGTAADTSRGEPDRAASANGEGEPPNPESLPF